MKEQITKSWKGFKVNFFVCEITKFYLFLSTIGKRILKLKYCMLFLVKATSYYKHYFIFLVGTGV